MDKTSYIEDYLRDEMSPEEKIIFEKSLKEDPMLTADYENHLAAYDVIKINGLHPMREVLIKHETLHSRKKKIRIIKIMVSMAASVLLFASLYFFLPNQSKNQEESLFASYFVPYRDPVSVRGDAQMMDMVSKANNAYRDKDYRQAVLLYQKVPDPDPVVIFYYGLSALQMYDSNLAVSLFQKVAQQPGDYQQQANWYLALSYVQHGDYQQAKDILSRIVIDGSYMHEKAEELLKKL